MADIVGNISIGDIANLTNLTNIQSILGEQVADKLVSLINIFKVAGVLVIIYLIYLIVRGFMSIRRGLLIKKIAKNVEEINHKLDRKIKKNKK